MDDKAPVRRPARKRRRWPKILAALAVLLIGLVAGLPRLLSTGPARGLIVARVNARLAPGSVALEGVSLSWTRPIELSGLALRDPKGKVVLASKSVRLDRGILGLLASRPDYGTITVEGAAIDVERRADGSIDLMEAIASAMKPDPSKPKDRPGDPNLAVVVVVKGGTLRVASPELVEPLRASAVDGSLTIAPGKPLEVAATLGDEGRSIEVHATLDHRAPAGAAGDLSAKLVGKGWPIHVRRSGVEALGRFEGTIEAARAGGKWSASGDSALLGVEASGPALAGDRPRFDRMTLAADVEQTATGWAVRKLDLATAVASLSASGTIPAHDGAKLRGQVDLAAVARLMPHAIRLKDGLTLESGMATIRGDLTTRDGVDRASLTASLDHVAATQGGRPIALREPAQLVASASRSAGKITVEALEVKAAGVDVKASGDLDAGVKLAGTVDLATLDAQARDLLDLGAVGASGHARVGADYRHVGDTYKIRFAADCKELKVSGLTAEPIARATARVDASASGPRAADGMPTGWREAQVDAKSADWKLDLAVTNGDDGLAVLAGAGLDVASPAAGRAEVKAGFVMKGRAFEIEQLRLGITPTDAGAVPLALAVRGRLDLATGEGAFTPLPGAPVGAVALLPEGVRVVGVGRADIPLKLNAALTGDLASADRLLASWSGTPVRGLGGAWGTHFQVTRSSAGKLETGGQIDVGNITAPGLKGPVSLAWIVGYAPDVDRLEVTGVNLSIEYAKLAMVGNLYEAANGRRICDLKATVNPQWAAIDPLVAKSIEPGATVRATVRPIQWKGVLRADTTPQLLAQQIGEVGIDLVSARAFGVEVGPAPMVLHVGGGGAILDPIATTANGGPVTIRGALAFDDAYGVWLRLNPGTKIEGAAINDAVSNAVLAYVAPVLSRATHVNGKVNVDIQQAALPITASGSMAILGNVVFQDVQFLPGPLGAEIASMVGQPAPKLALHQPMQLEVADGRVRQSGLSIPIAGDAKVDIAGSVGFDETLDLKATVPLSPRMLGIDPNLAKVAGGAKLAIPIRGTLARPAIDRRAFERALASAAQDAVKQGLKSEAAGLLDRVAGPNLAPGEPKGKPARRDALGELENLGREIIAPK